MVEGSPNMVHCILRPEPYSKRLLLSWSVMDVERVVNNQKDCEVGS